MDDLIDRRWGGSHAYTSVAISGAATGLCRLESVESVAFRRALHEEQRREAQAAYVLARLERLIPEDVRARLEHLATEDVPCIVCNRPHAAFFGAWEVDREVGERIGVPPVTEPAFEPSTEDWADDERYCRAADYLDNFNRQRLDESETPA
jgi:hypothetical protein